MITRVVPHSGIDVDAIPVNKSSLTTNGKI